MTDPAIFAYLRGVGHGAGYLHNVKPCTRHSQSSNAPNDVLKTTAMHEACYDGELTVCRWLCAHGFEGTLRKTDSLSRLPIV
jgi:hypothetical protein